MMDKLFYIMKGGIGALELYEWCAPSGTSHFSLSPEVNKSLY